MTPRCTLNNSHNITIVPLTNPVLVRMQELVAHLVAMLEPPTLLPRTSNSSNMLSQCNSTRTTTRNIICSLKTMASFNSIRNRNSFSRPLEGKNLRKL
jgi:hypothetical protein